ncbi:MAG: hypothetical protein LBH41_01060 [Rickettsiales bacterium]|jgi:hypothetical protein|nr:hypothetical protein [Rickettsiales bacterium]
MKKLLAILLVLSVPLFSAPPKKGRTGAKRASGAKKRSSARAASGASAPQPADESADRAQDKPGDSSAYGACMDSYCKSDMFPDKGRCRCSAGLGRIEKVLRDIDDAQNKADAIGRGLESRMNAENVAAIDNAMGSISDSIAGIENRAKTMASARVDPRLNVQEGAALANAAAEKCAGRLSGFGEDEVEGRQKEYAVAVEKDCGAYTTILKEKADAVQTLLAQAQKNEEMFNAQEYQKRNQLDVETCRVEYESCMKTECGVNFHFCREPHQQDGALNKCSVLNKGKCEDNKAQVMSVVKEYVKKELRKDDVAMKCVGAGGNISEGKCMRDGSPLATPGWGFDGYPTAKDLKGAF